MKNIDSMVFYCMFIKVRFNKVKNILILPEMIANLKIKLLLIFLWFVSQVDTVIYGTPLVFYSQLCQLGTVAPGTSMTFAITTATVQQNIVRTGIALSELSKPSDQYHAFNSEVTASGSTSSSFTITVNLTHPTSGMKMSYFLIVIKTQTSPRVYVDFVPFTWSSGTSLDNNNNSNRTINQAFTITSTTQFTAATSGWNAMPLTTSFRMYPKTSSGQYESDKFIFYQLTSSISSGTLTVFLRAYYETKITGFRGLCLIYSNTSVNTAASATGWNMSMFFTTWNDPNHFSLLDSAPSYGPSFHYKCIFGYNIISYRGNKTIDFSFRISAKGNFDFVDFPDQNDINPYGSFFCFGNGSSCGQNQTMTDNVSLTCHAPTFCPLKEFSTWTNTLFCPICTQLICLNCTPTNRSNCITCGVNSTVTAGSCVCNLDSWPWTTAISTSAVGLWNGVANSLTECRYNCTAIIPGCAFDKCTSNTLCTACLSGFYINTTTSTPNRNCISCTTITNCLLCSSSILCTSCGSGFIPILGVCTECRTLIFNCSTCTGASTCTLCETGYNLTAPNFCKCDTNFNPLTNCILCSVPTVCTQCVNTTFFISTADSLCHSCRDFDLNCITCTADQFCDSCDPGYTVEASGATQLCISCTTISNCLLCSSPTFCTSCGSGYTPVSGVCTECRTLIFNCSTCTDASTCTLCETGYNLTAPNFCKCDTNFNPLTNCILCSVPTVCTQCVNTTFFISTADSLCHSCRDFDLNCITCTADQFCDSCDPGYTVEASGATQLCISCTTISNCLLCSSPTFCTSCGSGYTPVSGVCTECRTLIFNCSTCTDASTCTLCETGYNLTAPNVCQCNTAFNPLTNCILCSVPTACTQCVNTTFFISAADSLCHSCREFDLFCITCTADQVCDSCDPGYTIVTVGSTSLCQACWDLIPNCTLCSSPTVCDVCNYTYGLTKTSKCQVCSTLRMINCEGCTDWKACYFCVNQTYLVNGNCYKCEYIYRCLTCFVNPIPKLQCLTCRNGFFLNYSSLTLQPECIPCMHFTSYCVTCTNTVCLSCVYPYLPGSDDLCSRCQEGFYNVYGICTNIAGCIRAAYLPNGLVTCIACSPELFFIFDQKIQKCVCKEGFSDFKSYGPLPECKAVCGDGMIVSEFEGCDDKNLLDKDGCDRNCQKQPGFDCGFLQPSICILELNVESFVFNYVYRVLGQNKALISYTIQPSHPGFATRPWNKILNLKLPTSAVNQSLISYSYTAETGQLLVTVPYIEELEATSLEVEFTLDPAYIKSTTPFISLVHKMNGINAKLIFEHESELQTHKNVGMITLVLTLLLLLQFYLGSYVHKMIGLETIQLIQAIYFVRMLTPSSSSNLLSSINGIQYASSGYQNAAWLYGDLQQIYTELDTWTTETFTMINLKKLFLLNANFSLFPILIALIAYVVTLVRKYRLRNEYLETKQQEQKDRYTQLQRSAQWVYDHFVFPYIMMFNLLSFFQCISLLSEPFQTEMQQLKQIESQSFIFHVFVVFCTTAIYCYEVNNSIQDYTKYRMTAKERQKTPKSILQKLQYDQNNADRANYHPAYVFYHLAYYFLLSLVMVISVFMPDFAYPLEFTMGLAVIYFGFICIFKPYHESIGIHNSFLKFYYGIYVLFLVICYLFGKLQNIKGSVYTAFMYVIMVMIGGLITAGFVRIIFELRFRKALENDSRIMQWQSDGKGKKGKRKSSQEDQFLKNVNRPTKSKKQQLVEKNTYTFDNQLIEMKQKMNNNQSQPNTSEYSSISKSHLMKKVQEDINKKRINLILQNYAQGSYQQAHQGVNIQPEIQQAIDTYSHQKPGEATIHDSSLLEDILQKKKQSPKPSDKSLLNSLKQKLRTQWVYMHQQ